MAMITILEMLIRGPEGRFVFQSMLGTAGFTLAFVAGAMYLIQDGLFRFQRYHVILRYGLAAMRQNGLRLGYPACYLPRDANVQASALRSGEPEKPFALFG